MVRSSSGTIHTVYCAITREIIVFIAPAPRGRAFLLGASPLALSLSILLLLTIRPYSTSRLKCAIVQTNRVSTSTKIGDMCSVPTTLFGHNGKPGAEGGIKGQTRIDIGGIGVLLPQPDPHQVPSVEHEKMTNE